MLVAFSVALLLLALMNWETSRSVLFPPAFFCLVWAAMLVAIALSGDFFFPVSLATLTVYLLGAIAFCLGGGIVHSLFRGQGRTQALASGREPRSAWFNQVLWVGLLALLIGIPFQIEYIQELAGGASQQSLFWWAVRAESIRRGELTGVKPFRDFMLDNLVGLATLLALTCINEVRKNSTKREKARAACVCLLAFAYNISTASRTGGMILAVSGGVIGSLRSGAVNLRQVLRISLFCVCVFAPAAIIMGKGGNTNFTLADNVRGTFDALRIYGLSGPVAFDQVVESPTAIPAVWSIWRFIPQTLNRLGADYEIPSLHAAFTQSGPNVVGNVYTMYFSYFPDFGWAGVVVFPFLFGVVATWLYYRARAGIAPFRILFGIEGAYIVMSGFNESLFNQLNFSVKAALFVFLLYGWRPRRRLHLHTLRPIHPSGGNRGVATVRNRLEHAGVSRQQC
jgi:oligosaccharide repeat unit polymerase